MKVAFVTSWLSSSGGGVSAVVEALSRTVAQAGIDVCVLGLCDDAWARDRDHWLGATAAAFPVVGPKRIGVSPTLRKALLDINPDVVHVHGLWMHISADVVAWSRGGKPYLVSPHGMLDPWALANSSGKKLISRWLYENKHLGGASLIHALCASEANSIQKYGLKAPISIIPNGVDIPIVSDRPPAPWRDMPEGRRVLLYIGRLHPKKNLHSLLQSLAAIKRSGQLADWYLAIAGWEQKDYLRTLVALRAELGLQNDVNFLGPVHGKMKEAALRNASAFVLPSVSEGLPMAVLEAWAHGLPVAMTAACNLPEGFEAGAAHTIGCTTEEMKRDLSMFLNLTPDELALMGARAVELVKSRFTWEHVAAQYIRKYRSLYERALLVEANN